ncbi:class I SAM-dependent methyltransferase [Enterococcus casseliflavus]|uniref:class I SAM-dependent methyltransferase n=1 Tax=Enterococcus casseliflavus TaxID=37734 RepID=UPI00132FE049|nr:class I SAM-dependent methyltransferase [Enterococcus casseliflavus]
MGREFIPIFSDWAAEYDETVAGKDEEYRAVFFKYEQLLAEIAEKAGQSVVEFGSGTGNLTQALLGQGKNVLAIEPSPEMRRIAKSKPSLSKVTFVDGDMEVFPEITDVIDTIVSTYVFHHLTEDEKQRAIGKYAAMLPKGGQVLFGDTMFLSLAHQMERIDEARQAGHQRLAADLQREYYPVIADIERYFRQHGFTSRFKQINEYVWLVEAQKE